MMDLPTRSPRRQHILSSINPDEPRDRSPERRHKSSRRRSRSRSRSRTRSRTPTHEHNGRARSEDASRDEEAKDGDTSKPRRSRLKLKDEKSRRRHRRRRDRSTSLSRPSRRDRPRSRSRSPHSRSSRHRDHDRSPSRHHRRHRHRHRRRHRSPTPPNPHIDPPLDPEAAFRESLFDAMADDEGAAYWEGVYGQPIHIYEEEYQAAAGEGTLEGMTDEEYAAYVRQKMWEKTNAGILEERARREQRRKEKEAQDRRRRELHEETLRHAKHEEDQRYKRRWEKRYAEYLKRWDDVPTRSSSNKPSSSSSSSRPRPSAETILPWPIDSGRREDITEGAVRAFFIRGLNAEEVGEKGLAAGLREERVRWHPDKIQQRLGGEVEEEVMKDVTAIFQAIDRLWTEVRGKG